MVTFQAEEYGNEFTNPMVTFQDEEYGNEFTNPMVTFQDEMYGNEFMICMSDIPRVFLTVELSCMVAVSLAEAKLSATSLLPSCGWVFSLVGCLLSFFRFHFKTFNLV